MPIDSYVQIAPDSTGKKVDMDQVASAAGDTIYQQRATLVGETGNILQALLEQQHIQTNILAGIFKLLASSNPEFAGVDPLDKGRVQF
jgi:hypothetical protein